MNQIITILLLFVLASLTIQAQDTIPHVKGNVTISVKKGTFECDLTLSNMPRLKNYFLRLNSGMNIQYIKNTGPYMFTLKYEKSQVDTLSSGESSAYYIPAHNKSGKYLPHSIRFKYVGMYPVITDTSSYEDWRGNIAFNGTTLRADGIQSAWCPMLYDVQTDTKYEKVTYDLDVTCEDCKVIYLNGNEPVFGTHAKLVSNKAQDLTMFVGDITAVSIDGDYFLNPDADTEQLKELSKVLHSYQTYLEKKLNIPYKGKVTYIQTTPVSKKDSWMFASYPTIVKIGWDEGMKTFANKEKGSEFLQYMAHELAHYYFGTVRNFNSEIGDMITEGFAEYLALHITQKYISDSLHRENIKHKLRSIDYKLNPKAIAKIRSNNDYVNRELYSYYYAPLLFSAIEKEIGEEKMWAWMRLLILSPTVMTDYTFFEQTLKNVVNDNAKSNHLLERYFNSDSSFQNIASTLDIRTIESPTTITEKPVTKTFYYYFISYAASDFGTSNNNYILHTEIGHATCTDEEFSKITEPISNKIKEGCMNDSGCLDALNTNNTMEDAQKSLKRNLDRLNENGNMIVKVLKL